MFVERGSIFLFMTNKRGDNSFLLKYRNIKSKLLKNLLKHDIKIHKLYN